VIDDQMSNFYFILFQFSKTTATHTNGQAERARKKILHNNSQQPQQPPLSRNTTFSLSLVTTAL